MGDLTKAINGKCYFAEYGIEGLRHTCYVFDSIKKRNAFVRDFDGVEKISAREARRVYRFTPKHVARCELCGAVLAVYVPKARLGWYEQRGWI